MFNPVNVFFFIFSVHYEPVCKQSAGSLRIFTGNNINSRPYPRRLGGGGERVEGRRPSPLSSSSLRGEEGGETPLCSMRGTTHCVTLQDRLRKPTFHLPRIFYSLEIYCQKLLQMISTVFLKQIYMERIYIFKTALISLFIFVFV